MQIGQQSVTLDEITAFTAVARSRSFAGAADSLGVDPSLLSRRVRRLEDALGIRLFVRTTRKVSMTEAGERYLARVGDILQQLEAAGVEAAELAEQPRGLLRVSLPISFGRIVVAPMMPGFLSAYPQIKLDFGLTNRRVDLIAEGIDLAIRMGDPRDSSLSMRKIGEYREILVAAPSYLAEHGTPDGPLTLAEHSCLNFSGNAHWPDWLLTDTRRTERLRPHGAINSDSSEALITISAGGSGIILTPDWMAKDALLKGELVHILPEWHGATAGVIQGLLPPGRMIPAKVRAFLDYVSASLPEQ